MVRLQCSLGPPAPARSPSTPSSRPTRKFPFGMMQGGSVCEKGQLITPIVRYYHKYLIPYLGYSSLGGREGGYGGGEGECDDEDGNESGGDDGDVSGIMSESRAPLPLSP